jgi:hypothetical protein
LNILLSQVVVEVVDPRLGVAVLEDLEPPQIYL